MNPLKALQDHGQAVWLDFLSRGFIAKGGLKKLVDEDGLRGVTETAADLEQLRTSLADSPLTIPRPRERIIPRAHSSSAS